MNKIYATLMTIAIGIILFASVYLAYREYTSTERDTALIEDAINNVLFVEHETD